MSELNISALEAMSTDELSRRIDEVELEAKKADEALMVIENTDNELALKLLELQRQRKENRIILERGKYNVKRFNRDLAILKRCYWRTKA